MPRAANTAASRTRSVVFCGLSVALMVVSAWVTIPIGVVPVTLQVFVMVFAVLALRPGEAVAAIAVYLLMGAAGLPVFSSMRGGIGVILGPTGGFLWGFLLAAVLAVGVRVLFERGVSHRGQGAWNSKPGELDAIATDPLAHVGESVHGGSAGGSSLLGVPEPAGARKRAWVHDFVAAFVFLLVTYLCGWLHLAFAGGMGLEAAFAAGVAPFVVIDLAKLVAAVLVAQAVRAAVSR